MSFKTISIIGSGYSGSSAIYDYLRLTNIFYDPFSNKEFSICYDPGGLMDIEYIIKNKSSIDNHTFIYNKFKKNINFYFANINNLNPGKNLQSNYPKFEEILEKYLESIVSLRYEGQTLLMNFEKNWLKNFLNKFFFYWKQKKNDKIILFKDLISFEKLTKKFFYQLFINYNNEKKNIILDQGGLYSNPISSTKYYQNSLCIIVDRDPRDIFVEYKYKSAFSYPKESVKKFCDFFINQRKTINLEEHQSNNVFKIYFEKFVLENKKSVLDIAKFLEIDPNFLLNNNKFNLDKSKKNIYKYKSLISNDENDYIKDRLKKYIL